MRVTIEHSQKQVGIFSKRTVYRVATTVLFTAEERALIGQLRLKDAIVMERNPPPEKARKFTPEELEDLADVWHLKISNLLKGTDIFECATPAEAIEYDDVLKASLQNLKNHLDNNSVARSGKQTFEL